MGKKRHIPIPETKSLRNTARALVLNNRHDATLAKVISTTIRTELV
jgi:hypothetical protein